MGAPSGPEAAAAAAAGQAPEINAELFSLWVSSTYMALARLGAPFPGAAERPGWAWAGRGDATDAVGVDNFVRVSSHDTHETCGNSRLPGVHLHVAPGSMHAHAQGEPVCLESSLMLTMLVCLCVWVIPCRMRFE